MRKTGPVEPRNSIGNT